LHVIEQDAPDEIHRDRHLTEAGEAEAYLKKIAKRFFPAVIKVNLHVQPPRWQMWPAVLLTIPRMKSNPT